jgi:hypothetical protein
MDHVLTLGEWRDLVLIADIDEQAKQLLIQVNVCFTL